MNTITIELCGEDRARLDRILTVLEGLNKPLDMTEGLAEAHTVEVEAPVADGIPVETVAPEKPKATKADVQAMVQKLATPTSGKRDEVKRIVNEYSPRVSGIPEDKLDEVMRRLTELDGADA